MQPPKFPTKPRNHSTAVYQKNLYNEKIRNLPSVKNNQKLVDEGKFMSGELNRHMTQPEIEAELEQEFAFPEALAHEANLTDQEIQDLKTSDYAFRKVLAYAPYHAFKHPNEKLPGYQKIVGKIIKDYEKETGQPLGKNYRNILNKITSYRYASKEDKQEAHFNDMIGLINEKVPGITATDLEVGSSIHHLVYLRI